MFLLDKIRSLFQQPNQYNVVVKDGILNVESNLPVLVNSAHAVSIGKNVEELSVPSNTKINVYGSVSINASGSLTLTSADDIMIRSGGRVAIDASRIDLNSGVADKIPLLQSKHIEEQ